MQDQFGSLILCLQDFAFAATITQLNTATLLQIIYQHFSRSTMLKRIAHVCFLALGGFALFLSTVQIANAQFTTAEERGLPANSAFSGSDIDTVNLQNGNLHVNIPILQAKQRGGSDLTWNLVFDTQTFIKQAYKYVYPNCEGKSQVAISATGASPAGTPGGGGGGSGTCTPLYYYLGSATQQVAAGWRLAAPTGWIVQAAYYQTLPAITCATNSQITYRPINNWHVVEPNGTQHPLAIYQELDSQGTCNQQELQGPTTDGSGMYFNTQTGVLTLKNGIQIQMTAGQYPGSFTGGSMTDLNGNQAVPNDTMNRALVSTTSGSTITYTSPDGHTSQGPSNTVYSVLDSNGAQRNYTVNYELIDVNPDICAQYPPGISTTYPCTLLGGAGPLLAIKQIILPNGFSYSFSYVDNSNGQIQQITLPTGATIAYTYSDVYQPKFAGTGVPDSAVGTSGVATRKVTVNGSTYTWNYNISNMGQTTSTTTVTDPLGNVTVHSFGTLCLYSCNVTSSNTYELSTTYSDSQNHLLRTITNTYTPDYDPVNNTVSDGRLVTQTTTLENGQKSQKQTTYDSFAYDCGSGTCAGTGTRMNPTAVGEYDYGSSSPGPLLRTINTSYQSFSIGGWTITKPQSVTTYDGANNQVAQTSYEYDNYSHAKQAMQASNAIQHSSSYGTNYTNRANVTAVSNWRNTDGATLTSTNQYDDAGNLLSVIDPMGNQTSYSYNDSWSNASCAPSGQGKLYRTVTTNAKGQSRSSNFNSCTGTVASTTDPNGTTSLSYDLLNRVSSVVYPTGDGMTTYCYSDNPNGSCASSGAWTATQTEAISGSLNVVHENIYDGLGRTIHSELTSDPEGTVTTDTVYDGLGRVSQVSNPYRSGDTEYWTTTSYDGIGRVIGVTEQDNSVTSTAYSGNTTTITDEAGHQRKSQTDGLGHLTTVWEDPNGLNYETDYTYNVLGDLLKAVQKGGSGNSASWRTRTFAYDSLGELLCSANPEITSSTSSPATCPNPDNGTYTSGTVRYAYDNDGNLHSRTAPLENQQSTATVTTTYLYDTLNRVTSKTYTDQTPSVTYVYDGGTIAGCSPPATNPAATNLTFRMSAMCDGSGATAWSYDPEGRTLAEARKIGSVTDQISYGYTLNGVVKAVTYPLSGGSTPFTLSYDVNAANRVDSVTDGTTTYAQVQSTWATGMPKTYLYANGVQFSDSYNARLQPLTLTAEQVSSSNTLFYKTYNFNTGSSGSQGHDNGTLAGVTDALDTLGLNRPNGSVNYTYDTLNRLSSAATTGTACTMMSGGTLNWGSSYTVDAWGNLTAKTSTLCQGEAMTPSTANASNQLSAASYDSAGNLIQVNGVGYTYDAEGRLVNGSGSTYTYDGMGERVAKPGKLYWKGTGSTALVETDANDKNPTKYIFFNGKRVARLEPAVEYYVTDNIDSTALLTGSSGNILNESLFFPYGVEQVIAQQDSSNNYKFTGKERDPETGLDDFGARYYNSSLGRFTTPDWDGKPTAVPYSSFGDPQTLNLYSYVENGPLNKVDADGHVANAVPSGPFQYNHLADIDTLDCSYNETACLQSELGTDYSGSEEFIDEAKAESAYTAEVAATQAANSTAQAQQHYGRQPDGSYKADPAKVKAAIAAKKPIIEMGGDGKAECVAACKFLSGAPRSGQWTQGAHPQPALGLNDSTDVGLAIATFDKSGNFNGNSGIYMGHDPKTGGIMIVDQWPDNGPKYDHPWQHTLANHGSEPAMSGDAYYVIHVP
jgi:RHS repeat-associated protein